MSIRHLIAYVLIFVLVASVTGTLWYRARQERLEKARRHGPRED